MEEWIGLLTILLNIYNPKENSILMVKEGKIMNEEEFYKWRSQYEDETIDQMVSAMNNKGRFVEEVIVPFPKPIDFPELAKIELRQGGLGQPEPFHLPTFTKSDETYQLAPNDEEVIKKEINSYLEKEKKYLENNKHELDALNNKKILSYWKKEKQNLKL